MRRCAGRRMRADEGEGGGNVTLLRRGWIFADVCGGSGPVGPRTGAARKRSRRRRRRSRARGGAVRIELGHRRALPLCGQSCVAGACAPGRRRLCVPGSARECCAGAKLCSGPWRGGGGKEVQTLCIINAIKGKWCLFCISQPFALEMESKVDFDAQRNAVASFARNSFACDGNRARTCNGEETRDEKRVRRHGRHDKTLANRTSHEHVAGAARGPRETYTTTGGRGSAGAHQTHTYQQRDQHTLSSPPSKPQTLPARDDARITTPQTKPSDPFHNTFLPLFSHTPHHTPLPRPHALHNPPPPPPPPLSHII